MRSLASVLAVLWVFGTASAAWGMKLDLTGIDVGRVASYFETLPPTPKGASHLGPVESGKAVQIRYAVPKKRPLSYQLDFHNIVAFHGGGVSYQLQLHRDSIDGALLYDGPVLPSESWNASHYAPIEIADKLTDADFRRGYLDILAVARTEGDQWTMYRDNDGDMYDLRCAVLEDTPALRKALAAAKLLRDKRIQLLPLPAKITAKTLDFEIKPHARILLRGDASDDDLFAAGLLKARIRELSGLALPVRKGFGDAKPADLVLDGGDSGCSGEGYRLATSGRFRASAGNSSGLFYAVQTALQLLRKSGAMTFCPGVEIVDQPAIPFRMVQYDIARSQTVNVNYIKRIIREMAQFKLNQLMFYMEDDFRYSKYPFTGRAGTFTPEKARELVAYARKFHVELVPQLESLGHGAALLNHAEFADLRENGDSWVFDTSNPRTWQVLDDMIGELAEVFSNTRFIHLGGDEFEGGFGKCPQCAARVKEIGWGGLYAEHMTKLNELAKKHGREMIFWTAHGTGDPATFGDQTLKYADKLPKDMIPMEWIYHGPSEYPTIKQYQEAGFGKLFVSPAVVGYSNLYPDFGTTFRGVSGFYRAGAAKKALGGCVCTWELVNGAEFETSLYGIVYSAQCAWNPAASDPGSFDRAFATHWFGLPGDWTEEKIHGIFWLRDVVSSVAGSGEFFWRKYPELRKAAGGGSWGPAVKAAPDQIRAAEGLLATVDYLKPKITRNPETLDGIATILRIYRHTGRKILAVDQAARLYRLALKTQGARPQEAGELLRRSIALLEPLRGDYSEIIAGLERNRDQRGGPEGDVARARGLSASLDDLLGRLKSAQAALKADPRAGLPAAEELGFQE